MSKIDYTSWSQDELIREIEKFKAHKKYGIVWEEKLETVAERCKDELPVLEEVKTKALPLNGEVTNIFIEGDNYHVLSVLNYTHKGQIDVIYIDPPYNRGTGDHFIYNDKIVDLEDSYRHSKWLSFMNKRLRLAKTLLKHTGIIFISIDDYEQAQLKLLCDEIFDQENFVGNLVWHKKYGGGSDNKNIVTEHEYVLCYSNGEKEVFQNLEFDFDETLGFEGPDEQGRYYKTEGLLMRGPNSSSSARPNLCYPIKCPDGTELWPREKKGTWRYSKETLQDEIKKNNIVFKQNKNGWMVYYKIFLYNEKGEERGKKARSILNYRYNIGQTGEGTARVKELLGTGAFNNPKPVSLIKHLIKLCKKSDVVLDFFAGSGTTAEAVLMLNKEDGGNRQFIICTDNQDNNGSGLKIAEDICYPRIKTVMKELQKEHTLLRESSPNLKYFKTTFVNAKPTDENKKRLVLKSTEMLCLKESCFDKLIEKDYFRIYKNNKNKFLGIICEDEGIESFKKELIKLNKKATVYVFSLDDSTREEEFEDVAGLVELRPIPAVILNVYKRIFK